MADATAVLQNHKAILNNPEDCVPEMLAGILAANPHRMQPASGATHCIVRAGAPVQGKVSIVTGGGSGHLPVFLGGAALRV